MNVMNRRMFANRNARRRLANMGGIMTSSPELMQAGQTFQTGGSTLVKLKTVRIGDPLGGTNYDLYSDGSAVMLSTGRRIDPSNASAQPLLQMLQDLPDVSDTSDMSQPPVIKEPVLESAPITEDERGILSRIGSSITDFVKADLAQGFPKLPDSREAKDQLIRGEIADRIRSGGSLIEGQTASDDTSPSLTYGGRQERDKNVVPEQGPATSGGRNIPREPDIEKDSNIGDVVKKIFNPPDRKERIEEEKLEKDFGTETEDIPFSDIPGFTGDQEKDSKEELEDIKKKVDKENSKGGDPLTAASSGILNTAGVDTSNMGRKERIKSMKAMLSDVLGYDDEDQKEEFWLTMASIGFGIAAGQDSNALTNIAQGLAEGSSKLMENKATRQAREDKLTLTAFGEVLADERATTKFGRDLKIAEARASGTTNKYTSERERSRLKEVILGDPYAYPGLLGDNDQIDPYKLNTYLDRLVTGEITEKPKPTQEEAIAEYNRVLETKPELKSVMLTRLEKNGYDITGLK